jgi:L-amino acid N-acyltransferase YncA
MTAADYPAVAEIYREGIATGHATFNTDAPSWEQWDTGHLTHCRLVAVDGERVLGWAALSGVSDRCVWTLQAGIFPENTASVTLHERAGFRLVGRRERLGQMKGWWRDVLLFERRSSTVGIA